MKTQNRKLSLIFKLLGRKSPQGYYLVGFAKSTGFRLEEEVPHRHHPMVFAYVGTPRAAISW
jgi:hypothetical protein